MQVLIDDSNYNDPKNSRKTSESVNDPILDFSKIKVAVKQEA
jgi:hypothetical protein